MRVALVSETFTPAVNGVVTSVLRAADHLALRGHEPVVVAPSGQDYETRCGAVVPVHAVMRAAGIDLRKLSRDGVEIFFTQVFRHGFFHGDMHPGNILVGDEGHHHVGECR